MYTVPCTWLTTNALKSSKIPLWTLRWSLKVIAWRRMIKPESYGYAQCSKSLGLILSILYSCCWRILGRVGLNFWQLPCAIWINFAPMFQPVMCWTSRDLSIDTGRPNEWLGPSTLRYFLLHCLLHHIILIWMAAHAGCVQTEIFKEHYKSYLRYGF